MFKPYMLQISFNSHTHSTQPSAQSNTSMENSVYMSNLNILEFS